jgi:hypothetical protein
MERRQFIEFAALLGAAGLGAEIAIADQAGASVDSKTLDFWIKQVRKPVLAMGSGIESKGGPPSPEEPAFVYFDPEKKTFSMATDLDDTDLPTTGDLNVGVRVTRFRPSVSDASTFQDAGGNLRIDVGQTSPLPGLTEALAWTTVAAFMPNSAGKLPSLDKLQFDPGKAWNNQQTIPMPQGLGFWSWNFFVKKREQLWGKFVNLFIKSSGVFPLLPLPAIAITALQSIDKVVGYLQAAESSTWLLKGVSTPIYGTKVGKGKGGSDAIRMRTGTYLIMPQTQLAQFGDQRDKLELQQGGYLVPKSTDEFKRIDAAAKTLPEVTYLAVAVTAEVAPEAKSKPA